MDRDTEDIIEKEITEKDIAEEETPEKEITKEEPPEEEIAERETAAAQNPAEVQQAYDTDEIVRERKQSGMQIDPRYSGIGGWLILVMIGLFATPIRLLFLFFNDLLPIFTDGTLQQLTSPGTEFYHPLWLPLLLFEVCGNSFLAIFAIVLLVFFFRRKKVLPKLMVVIYASNILFIMIDEILYSFIPFIAAQSDLSSYTELVRSIITGAVWIPYFCTSVRVKSTFVR
ncbi:MAG TPA: DUF2569 domain-containing protein [Clostridia bacterium]|nr:DUF2569 domain-containing protein [Clostridia bacterium]